MVKYVINMSSGAIVNISMNGEGDESSPFNLKVLENFEERLSALEEKMGREQ